MASHEVEVFIADGPGVTDRLRQPVVDSAQQEVQLGALRLTVRAMTGQRYGPSALTIDGARHDVSFPSGVLLRGVKSESGAVHVGPIIGVLTAGHLSRNRFTPRQPFAYQCYLFRHLAEVGRRARGFVFAFEPVGIDWLRDRIDGWAWSGGRWLKVRMPFPDAVYNRIPNRRLESQLRAQQAISGLRRSGVPLFNPKFIDKSQLYECLRADSTVGHYLPETAPLQHHSQVTDLLARNPIVYLKPRFGSLGNGIFRLERLNGRAVRVRFRKNNRNSSQLLSLAGLPEFVGRLQADRDYVCQQGIDLPLFYGRPFDVRILTQKDGQGRWRLTGMGVRVAGPGSITTHVPSGGSIANIGHVLATVFGDGANRVASNLRAAIAEIAPAIERGLHDDFGEFSMDLGVDRQGTIWFFEANSKPHKFDEDSIRLLSWERTVQYAAFLGGFAGLGE